jgi:hypothetical protein
MTPSSEESSIAKGYWDKTVVRCGDTYFTARTPMTFIGPPDRGVPNVAAFKGFSYGLQSDGLTEAGRLNGFQWRGHTWIQCTSYRLWDRNEKRWGFWLSAVRPPGALAQYVVSPVIELEKFKGRWLYGPSGPGGPGFDPVAWQEIEKYNPQPTSCSQVPPE